MSFENDIMISYAWRDNEPPPLSNGEGWVSGFHQGLEYWLKQVMPRAPRVWRDKNQMPGNKVFEGELDHVVTKSAVLVTVLSEPYLSSEWCRRELEHFSKAATAQGGLQIANDYRIFKINKFPVDREVLPPSLSVVTGFDFYELDGETRVVVPIDPTLGDAARQRFIRKVYDVAVALARILKQIEDAKLTAGANPDEHGGQHGQASSMEVDTGSRRKSQVASSPEQSGLTIFIPFATRDLREVREDLVAELSRRNCRVLPEEQTATDDPEVFRKEMQAYLSESDVSVHLIGSRYGSIMEGETRSVVDLQNEWAAEESSRRGLKRLIWIPKSVGEITGQQLEFVQRLKSDRNTLIGADLLEESIENLKSNLLEMIKPKPRFVAKVEESIEHKIYLMHDECDKELVREFRKMLRDIPSGSHKFKLLTPVFDGDAASLREIQRQRIIECDTVLLFWGGSSQAWIDAGLGEIRKSPAYGRTNSFKANHLVYLTGPKTSAKEDWLLDAQDGLLEEDLFTVNALEGISDDLFATYIQSLP